MASPRVSHMGGALSRFGDIHQALGYRWTAEGEETLFLRSKVLVDAKAAGIRYPISGMWGGALDDLDGLRAFATGLRNLGYYGMMLGSAEHVPLVHEVFTPTAEEIAYWRELDELAARGRTRRQRPDPPRRSAPGRGPRRAHRPRRLGPPEPRLGPRPRRPRLRTRRVTTGGMRTTDDAGSLSGRGRRWRR